MGKQMVRCPRVDRVTVPSAMIHLLSCGTVDHGRFVWSRQLDTAGPPKSVSIRQILMTLEREDHVRNGRSVRWPASRNRVARQANPASSKLAFSLAWEF